MAVVSFDRNELEKLVGKKLSDNVLKNKAPMMGCDIEGIEEDEVEIEIFPNRPDLLSVEGFARSFRQFLGISEELVTYKCLKGDIELFVEDSVKDVRPFISAGVVRDVKLSENILKSLMQVQEKIHATFGRGRRKVAIGIHDMREINPPFTYKGVKPDSVEFVPLQADEKMNLLEIGERHPKGEYTKVLEGNDRWPIIIDRDDRVLSFPPVINGTVTKLTENTDNIFIDVTGTDQKAVDQALNLIVTELAERGGKPESVWVDSEKKPDLSPRKIKVDLEYANKLLNLNLSEKKFKSLLQGMGFGYSDGKTIVPCYRVDILHPIDIVEDVAISYGYENFEPKIPNVPGIGKPIQMEEFTDKIRDLIIGFGFQEVITSVLTNLDRQFHHMEQDVKKTVKTRNPLSQKHNTCRRKLLPELLGVLEENKHRSYPQKIFEIGDVLIPGKKAETGAKNVRKLSAVISDQKVNYTDLAGITDSLLKILNIPYELEKKKSPIFLSGRGAKINCDKETIGKIGEINPLVLENWDIEKPVVGAELNLNKIRGKFTE